MTVKSWSLLAALFFTACSSTRAPTTPQSGASSSPPPNTTATEIVVTPGDAGTGQELFDKARGLLLDGKLKEAAELFDAVAKASPTSKLAPSALANAGLALEGLGDRDGALERYTQVISKFADDPAAKTALLRSGRVNVFLERWKLAQDSAETLLARTDLTVGETIEANGTRGLAAAEQGDMTMAVRYVERARTLMEKYSIGASGRLPHEVTQVHYALGEISRIESEKILFVPQPPDFGDVFERRAQGLLDAQRAYTDAMRTTDPTWAAMAGFRVGKLYQQLHRDVMAMDAPSREKNPEVRAVFEGALRVRYKVLLEKGLKMMVSTVGLTERTQEQSVWAERANKAKAELEKALADENAAIAKLPISEANLKKILEDIEKKAKK